LTESELRDDLISDGLVRVKNFSWDRSAKETLEYLIN